MGHWKAGDKVIPIVAGFTYDLRDKICEVVKASKWSHGVSIKYEDGPELPYSDYQLKDPVTGFIPPKPAPIKYYNVVIRRKIINIDATNPEEAKTLAIQRYQSEESFDRLHEDYDIIVEEKQPNSTRGADRALTENEMHSEMQHFVGQHGWKKLFELIRHDFGFHAFDRGEREDFKPRPKNNKQYDLITKLCEFEDDEFEHGK